MHNKWHLHSSQIYESRSLGTRKLQQESKTDSNTTNNNKYTQKNYGNYQNSNQLHGKYGTIDKSLA